MRITPLLFTLVLALMTTAGCCHKCPPCPTTQRVRGTAVANDADDEEAADAKNPPPKTLYDRIGGEAAIVTVVDDLVLRAIADPNLNFTRKGTPHEWQPTEANVARLKQRLVQFLGTATGGPQRYEGEDMRTAHRDMRIGKAEFDVFVKDFQGSLELANVPEKERKELLEMFRSARGPIVETAAPVSR